MEITRNSGLIIPKTIGLDKIQNIKDFLTRVTQSYQNSPSVTLKFYLENDIAIKVPRYFPIQYFVEDFVVNDVRTKGEDINIQHKIKLRDTLQQNTVNYILSNDKGIIKAGAGSGKTVMSIYSICEIGKKTIIIVHRDSLVSQWIGPGTSDKPQGFLSHTYIKPDEIGRLSASNFQECIKKPIIVATNQLLLSLLKSYRTEIIHELKDSNIGVLFSDECHTTTGAPSFSECSLHIPAYKTFGLSATPSRSDGTLDIMEYHLGEVWEPEGISSVMDGRVTVVLFNSGMIPKSTGYIYYGGCFQRSRYLKILKNSKIFMGICESLIKKFYNEGRNIIFVGERVKLLELLNDKLKLENSGLFVGGSSLDNIEKQLTYTTPGKSRDGVDYVSKDCVIMSSPIGNVDQMTGRVLRPKEDKLIPLLIDMTDIGIPDIRNTFIYRYNFYKSRNWEIQFIHAREDGIKKLSEEDGLKIVKGEI